MSKSVVPSANMLRALKSAVIESLESRSLLSSSPITPHNLIQADTLKNARTAVIQSDADYWRPRSGDFSLTRAAGQSSSYINASNYRAFALDTSLLEPVIDSDNQLISIPRPDGTIQQFIFEESHVMADELAAQFPDIKTYSGLATDGSGATIAFDQTPLGFHAQVIESGKTYYIDPFYHMDQSLYASYWRKDMQKQDSFDCDVKNDIETAARGAIASEEITSMISSPITNRTSDTQLRNYRLACAANAEYTAFFGGTVALGQAAVVTAINRVNQVYESELSIHLTLIANNSSLIFTNTNTDGYTNSDGATMLDENQAKIDSLIGNANYDIGHVFSTGGGGIAGLGVVGFTGEKAWGVTGSSSPTGDAFWIDYVAHEMGHQFGGNHTFNTSQDSNRNASTAYEPGSGSTIMAYAGIEGTEDLQSNSDPYFAWKSIDEITTHVDVTIPSVGTRTNTNNSIPTVSGGSNYSIPINTPFALTATGSDANGDTIYYSWEQADLGAARLLTQGDNGASPLFRVYNPTTSPTRSFPKLASILNGLNYTAGPAANTKVEQLPTTGRTMKFVITARDQRAGGGGTNVVSASTVNITSVLAANGFLITNMNSATQFTGGTTQVINWNVANTTAAPISTANVQILMSTDGGTTFPTVLAASTANDGTEIVTLPNLSSTQVRFKVAAVGNIYFDINNANITINAVSDTTAPTISSSTFNYQSSQSNSVVFSESVTPSITSTANFNVVNLTTGVTVPSANITSTFNTSTNTQTINYSSLLANGNYRITYTGVTDVAGNPLGGTKTVDFYVLAGDANRDRHVDSLDQTIVTTNLNTSGKNFTQGDFNYDGSVNSADQTILNNNLNFWLPGTGAVSIPGTINIDNVTLSRMSAAQVSIVFTTGNTYLMYTGGITTMTFSGGVNNDILTLNYATGIPFSGANFAFDGGNGTDSLRIIGTTGVDTAVFGTNNITIAGTAIVDTTNESRSFNGNSGNDNLTVNGGIEVQLNAGAAQSFNAISLTGGSASVPAGSGEIDAKSLSISAASYLEINNNNLVIDYTSAITSPYNSIVNYVKTGTPDLGGSGLTGIRSSYVNNNLIGGTFLAVVDNAGIGIPANSSIPFVTENSVIVRYTWFGDADLNGKVDGADYALTDTGFISGSASHWLLGDYNYSGTTTGDDYALVDTGFIAQNQVL